jgi:hypothetical protein
MIHTSNWIWKLMEKCVLSLFTKNFSKITTKSMFYGSLIKQQIKFVVFNTKICNFFTKYLHLYSHSQNVYLWMSSTSPKLPLLGIPQVTINMNKKTKFNKNSNPQLSNGQFLSTMPCKPKKYVIYLLP